VKTLIHDLSGPALDWMTALAQGEKPVWTASWLSPRSEETPRKVCRVVSNVIPAFVTPYEPSTRWLDGAPIFEWIMRHGAEMQQGGPQDNNKLCWLWLRKDPPCYYRGRTLLEAIARCRVGMAYGTVIEVPDFQGSAA